MGDMGAELIVVKHRQKAFLWISGDSNLLYVEALTRIYKNSSQVDYPQPLHFQ